MTPEQKEKAKDEALEAYERATAVPREIYVEATNEASDAYERAIAKAREAYDKRLREIKEA